MSHEKMHYAYYDYRYNGTYLDPYRILSVYGITHPAQQHAVKKLLRAGRGTKDLRADITEARDTLNRWLAMLDEDAAVNACASQEAKTQHIDPEKERMAKAAIDKLLGVTNGYVIHKWDNDKPKAPCYVLHGPQSSGKARYAERIAAALGCTSIVYEARPVMGAFRYDPGILYVTNETVFARENGVRAISINEAIRLIAKPGELFELFPDGST